MYQNEERFPYNAQDTAIALSANGVSQGFIANAVMPYVRVNERKFEWKTYDFGDEFQTTDDIVSEKGKLNEVEYSGTSQTSKVVDRGLKSTKTNEEIASTGGTRSIGGRVQKLTNTINRNREIRVAAACKNTANAKVVESLAVADRFGESGVKSEKVIEEIRQSMLFAPNIIVGSDTVISKIRRAPDVVRAYNGISGAEVDGKVPLNWLAEYFEVDQILVGKAKRNKAAKGIAADVDAVWESDFLSLIYQKPELTTQSLMDDVTWGMTARWHGPGAPSGRVAGRKSMPDYGLHGGVEIRSGESVHEVVLCTECMAIIQNPVNL